jgi:hypothetical protein
MKKYALMVVVFLFAGCTIGNGHICGPQTPTAYCNKEAYEKLMHPKPYGAHWIKEGMTQESRRNDSWSCGAAKTIHAADYVVFSEAQKISTRIPTDKDDYGPDERLTVQWNTCMKSKGYVYLDQCDSRCLYP